MKIKLAHTFNPRTYKAIVGTLCKFEDIMFRMMNSRPATVRPLIKNRINNII